MKRRVYRMGWGWDLLFKRGVLTWNRRRRQLYWSRNGVPTHPSARFLFGRPEASVRRGDDA